MKKLYGVIAGSPARGRTRVTDISHSVKALRRRNPGATVHLVTLKKEMFGMQLAEIGKAV